MAVIQDVNINVHGQPSEKRLQTFLRLSQNENGRMINFRVLGSPLPSNCTATFSGTKPDGNVYSKTGTVTGNFVVIEEDIQMTAVAGVWDAKLDIINGTHNIMTALIRVVVDADVVDPDAIASDSQLQGLVAEAKYYAEHARTDAYGSPLTATTAAEMTDKTRVYVYTGSESGMTAGNWYTWNGSAWVSGGVYNAVAVQTDTTLSISGKAADAKKTGDEIGSLKEDLNIVLNGNKNVIFAGAYNLTKSDLIQGTYKDTDGSVSVLSDRIRVVPNYHANVGDKISFTPGTKTQRIGYGYRAWGSGTSFSFSGWTSTQTVITFDSEREIIIIFSKSSGAISPSDFDATVTITPSRAKIDPTLTNEGEVAEASVTGSNILNIRRSLACANSIARYGAYDFPKSDLVVGSYMSADGSMDNVTNRIRTKDILALNEGDILILTPGNVANRVLFGYRYGTTGRFTASTVRSKELRVEPSTYTEVIPLFKKSDESAITLEAFDGKLELQASDDYYHEDRRPYPYSKLITKIVNGSYENVNGRIYDNDKRIRSCGIIQVSKGDLLRFVPGENAQKMLFGYRSSANESFQTSEWYQTAHTHAFGIDGEIIIVFAKKSSTATIDKSEYDATTELIYHAAEMLPTSHGQEVGYKVSQQYTGLKWTPLAGTVPKPGGATYYTANSENTGMPYSDAHLVTKRVGIDMNLKTFMTALHNPYSLLYTENINADHSESAYGVTYYGDNLTGAYMGMSCNILMAVALGMRIPYSSSEVRGWCLDEGIFERVYDQSAKGLELMDVLSKTAHVALVTRLWRGKHGTVEYVQVSESIQNNAKNTVMTADEFDAYLASNHYTILRYKDLYKNINYTPSEFVAVEDETLTGFSYNDDICTFAGDYATFAEGDLIYINYTKGSYNSMAIYKGTTLLETISLSADSHAVDLSEKGYTYGKYRARLTDGTNHSDYTYFEILNADIALSEDTLTFSSENAGPVYYVWMDEDGYSYKKTEFTESEITEGSADVSDKDQSSVTLGVVFEGDYGRITKRIVT